MTVLPFQRPPRRAGPPQRKPNSRWWYLSIIPAFMFGCLLGWLLLAALPGIIIISIWYGSESYRHPEIIGYLIRPGMLIGGVALSTASYYLISRKNIGDFL